MNFRSAAAIFVFKKYRHLNLIVITDWLMVNIRDDHELQPSLKISKNFKKLGCVKIDKL
jgi:hypothetical protein